MSPRLVLSANPLTGSPVEVVAEKSSPGEVDAIIAAAAAALDCLESAGRQWRAELLRRMAAELDRRAREIIDVGVRETALSEARLQAELARTVFQARSFATVVDEGAFLEAMIDHPRETPMGPAPDLRRMLVPLGPVAVFGASNFPLAFSVPGGDTMAALAAGCPVIVKVHSSHPALSRLCHEALSDAVRSMKGHDGTVGLVWGTEAGVRLIAHPGIKAASFTGSLRVGRTLLDIVNARDEPIPFYGELASINPVFILESAARTRPLELAQGLVGSITGSAGQLCTKPGVVFVPCGSDGDTLMEEAAALISAQPPHILLNRRIADAYGTISNDLEALPGIRRVARGQVATLGEVAANLYELSAFDLTPEVFTECFGPTTVVVRYAPRDLERLIEHIPNALAATIHADPEDDCLSQSLVARLAARTGRLLFEGWPTGVSVSWAQHHGGPWPATNSIHTSVGMTSVRRFQRPLTLQSAPASMLPAELTDDFTTVPRRVDGHMVAPHQQSAQELE
jgi:NADP-dependent aldehyde dehydrogenase